MHLEKLIHEVIRVAKQAGDFIRHERRNFDPDRIEYKGLNDLVSYVDKTAEKIIVTGKSTTRSRIHHRRKNHHQNRRPL